MFSWRFTNWTALIKRSQNLKRGTCYIIQPLFLDNRNYNETCIPGTSSATDVCNTYTNETLTHNPGLLQSRMTQRN